MNYAARVVMPGDIFLTRGSSLISRGIRFCTRSFGESRSQISHVGFVSSRDMLIFADCIEALTSIVEHSLWEKYVHDGTEVAIYRVRDWTDIDRHECIELARKYKGRRYGYPALITHFLDWCLQGAYVFRRLTNSPRYAICSWLVDYVASTLRVHFVPAKDAGCATPDDIWDYIQTHRAEFKEILPLGRLG